MDDKSLKFLHIGDAADRRAIAVRATEGATPGLVWLGGYKSDMKGTRPRRLPIGRQAAAAPACVSTIQAMANRAAPSPTAPFRAGSPKA